MNKGPAFLLKVGNGAEPPAFATIAGLRTTSLLINGAPAVPTDQLPKSSSLAIAGRGIFTGSAAETRVKSNALGGLTDDYELSFESGQRWRGRFLITRLDYAGDYNGERNYSLALESAGPVRVL